MAPRFSDFRDLYGSPSAANYNIHVSTRDRYIYFVNPKVACSSIKATLNMTEAARTGQPLTLTSMEEVHSREHNPLLVPRLLGASVFRKMMGDADVTRFTFVRDPVRRMCSAYLSKLGEGKHWSKESRKLREYLGHKPRQKLTLEAFVHACAEDDGLRDLDPHWRLQRKQIAWDLVDYSFIGRHEHFADDFAVLTTALFGAPAEVFDSRTEFGKFSASPKLTREISGDLRKLIERIYAADYQMLAEINAREMWQPPKTSVTRRLRRLWRRR